MESYARHWQELIFTSHLGLEGYWIRIGIFAAACLLIGAASYRLRLVAVTATAVVFAAYVAAVVPFMVWASSCSDCRVGSGETRSSLLFSQHMLLGGFFAMGVAALSLGVLLSQAAKAIMARRPSPRPSVTPLPGGEGPGVRA
jgi:hypothetical protein